MRTLIFILAMWAELAPLAALAAYLLWWRQHAVEVREVVSRC